jgi:hypothetical protein
LFLSFSSFETRWFAKTGSGQTFNEEEEVEEKTSSLMFSSHQPWEGAAVHAPPAARLIAARRSGSFRGNTSCEFLSATSPSASSDVSEVVLMGRMSAQPVGGVLKEDASAVGLFEQRETVIRFIFHLSVTCVPSLPWQMMVFIIEREERRFSLISIPVV